MESVFKILSLCDTKLLECTINDAASKELEACSNNKTKQDEINGIKDMFLKKVKETSDSNEKEFEKILATSSLDPLINMTKSVLAQGNKAQREESNREFLKHTCWYIKRSYLKNPKISSKYPLGVLVVTDLHLSEKTLEYYRNKCEEYVYDEFDEFFDIHKKIRDGKISKISKYDEDDDDDDDDELAQGYAEHKAEEKANCLSQEHIARHEIFVKITERLNSETDNKSIIIAACGSIKELNLSDMSELCNIDHLALKNFTNLKYLDLSDTYIETVHPQAFKSLTSLETLKILNTSNDGFCWLHYLPTDCFKSNKNLKSLFLTIEQISATTLEGLVKLENLELNLHSKDHFEIWRLDPFKGLKNLKKLTFNWCENDSFNTTYFEDDDDDESYDYDDSEEEEDYRKYLANKRVSIKNSLTHINLNECSFLKWIPNLEELSLTGLNNEFFNKKNCFKHVPKLKVIHIEKTSLKNINSELFSGLKFVTDLSLAFNEIKSIDVNAFKDLNKLETLKLNNNKIENLDDNTFVKLTKLQQLDLSGNIINEKTISKNLIQKLRSTVKNFSLIENKTVALKTLSTVSDKVKRINEEFTESSLMALITDYFNKIIDQIDFVEKRSTKTMKSDEIEKIAKLKIEFIKKVKEIEAYNLNEFKLNSKSIIARINELKQLKLEDNDFEFKQKKELIKLNCWHIYSSDLKLRSIRLKFPLGLLVSINLHVPNEMLYFFRKKCEIFTEDFLLSTEYSDEEVADSILNEDDLANIFIGISKQIRDENQASFLIEVKHEVTTTKNQISSSIDQETNNFALILQQLNKKLAELEFNLANTSVFIRDHYSEIRKKVKQAKLDNTLVDENELFKKIDTCEKETIGEALLEINQKKFKTKLNEIKSEHIKWNKNLNDFKIDNQLTDQAMERISKLAIETENINELIFNGKMLNFDPIKNVLSFIQLNSFDYQIDLSKYFVEVTSKQEQLLDRSDDTEDMDEDRVIFCVLNCSFFSNGDLLIAGELASEVLCGEPCTNYGVGTYGIVFLLFDMEKNELKKMKKFNVFSESWTHLSIETVSNKVFFMYQYREDNDSRCKHRPGNEIEYENANAKIVYEHYIYVYLTMNEKLEKIHWSQGKQKQLIGLNDSCLFFTHDMSQKSGKSLDSMMNNYTLYIYNWSMKFVKRVGQANDPEAPFYLFFNPRRCAPYKHNFFNICGKYFFTGIENSLRIVDEKTGKLLKTVKGNLLTIDSNFNIILEDKDSNKVKCLKYLSFNGELLKQVKIEDTKIGELFLDKNNTLCGFNSESFTFFKQRK